MDFGIRELLMFVGALIFIGVLVDGIRRFQQNRRSQVKVKIDRKAHAQLANEDDEEDLSVYRAELPNGGARVVNKRAGNNNDETVPEQKKITPRFSEPLDILMEGMSKREALVVKDEMEEKNKEKNDASEENFSVNASQDDSLSEEWSEKEPFLEKDYLDDEEEDELESARPITANKGRTTHNQRDLFSASSEEEHKEKQISAPEPKAKDLPEEILAISVMAKGDGEFSGAALLEAILAFGLRYGDMDIFHRHEQSNGQGPVIFSMANALNPGTFNLESMPEERFKGVTFFMRLSQLNKRIFVLELMLDIAKRLANQLDGELKDDSRSVLSSQTVTHYKSRIQEYERRYLGQVLRS